MKEVNKIISYEESAFFICNIGVIAYMLIPISIK